MRSPCSPRLEKPPHAATNTHQRQKIILKKNPYNISHYKWETNGIIPFKGRNNKVGNNRMCVLKIQNLRLQTKNVMKEIIEYQINDEMYYVHGLED